MKLTLEIDTDDPQQIAEARELLQLRSLKSVLWDFDLWLRNKAKHGDDERAAEIREELHKLLQEEGVTIE